LIETVLHETGNYKGFNYLTKFQLPPDITPGVNVDDKNSLLDGKFRFANTDDTRRRY
jgi:hypothetical protein